MGVDTRSVRVGCGLGCGGRGGRVGVVARKNVKVEKVGGQATRVKGWRRRDASV